MGFKHSVIWKATYSFIHSIFAGIAHHTSSSLFFTKTSYSIKFVSDYLKPYLDAYQALLKTIAIRLVLWDRTLDPAYFVCNWKWNTRSTQINIPLDSNLWITINTCVRLNLSRVLQLHAIIIHSFIFKDYAVSVF